MEDHSQKLPNYFYKMNRFIIFLSVLCFHSFANARELSDKVIICGVCKNVEPFLSVTVSSMENIGKLFSDYKIIIYENNSTDNTPLILQQWARRNPRVFVTCENLSENELLEISSTRTFDNKPCRMELIARARNIVLKEALLPKYDDYKYLIMIDMDFLTPCDLNGIVDSLRKKEEWDAICANGIDSKGLTYDRYAFRASDAPLGPELLGESWWKELHKTPIKLVKKGLYPVYSAFGGMAIYKRKSIKGCQYSGVVTPELANVILKIIEKEKNHSQVNQYLNMTKDKTAEVKLQFVANSGYFGPAVCCEHVTFHAAMTLNGHGKIFVNPRMIMRYGK